MDNVQLIGMDWSVGRVLLGVGERVKISSFIVALRVPSFHEAYFGFFLGL